MNVVRKKEADAFSYLNVHLWEDKDPSCTPRRFTHVKQAERSNVIPSYFLARIWFLLLLCCSATQLSSSSLSNDSDHISKKLFFWGKTTCRKVSVRITYGPSKDIDPSTTTNLWKMDSILSLFCEENAHQLESVFLSLLHCMRRWSPNCYAVMSKEHYSYTIEQLTKNVLLYAEWSGHSTEL